MDQQALWRQSGKSHDKNPDPEGYWNVDKAAGTHAEMEYRRLLSARYQWKTPDLTSPRLYGWSTTRPTTRRLGEAQWAVHVEMGQ